MLSATSINRSSESGSRYGITHNGNIYSYQGHARFLCDRRQWQTRVVEVTQIEDCDDGPIRLRTVRRPIADWADTSDKFNPQRLRGSLRAEFGRRGWITVLSSGAKMPLIRGIADDGIGAFYEFALAKPRCSKDVEATMAWKEADDQTRALWRRVQARLSFELTVTRLAAAVDAAGVCDRSADAVAGYAQEQYDRDN